MAADLLGRTAATPGRSRRAAPRASSSPCRSPATTPGASGASPSRSSLTADHRPPGVRQGVQVPRRRAGARARSAPTAGPTSAAIGRRDDASAPGSSSARRPATRTASSTRSPTWPRWPPSGASSSTSTPASAAGCCRGGSGSASRCRRGTSGSRASPRSRPTSTSTATPSRARRSSLYRDRDLLERQFFLYDDWPGGLYASATTAGTRPARAHRRRVGRHQPPRRRRLPAPGRRWSATPPGGSRPASRPSTGCRSPTTPTCRCSSSASDHAVDIGARRRRDGRPGLAPRPPAGRPAPDGLAVPRHRSPTSSSPTSPTRWRPTTAPAAARRPPTAASPEPRSPADTVLGAVLTGGAQLAHGARQGARRGRRRADGAAGRRRAARRRRRPGASASAATQAALEALGLESVADDHCPGEGPLGGLRSPRSVGRPATASGTPCVVAACDQPWLDGGRSTSLLFGLLEGAASPDRATGRRRAGRRCLFGGRRHARCPPVVTALSRPGSARIALAGRPPARRHRPPDRPRPPARRRQPRRPALTGNPMVGR